MALSTSGGQLLTRMHFDPWGQRQDISGELWNQWATGRPEWANVMLSITPRGFTGHGHLDDHGIIHMNGRIYDPHLGRFLQADPFIEDTGTLNRYTYVHNNPLGLTDPSGYFSKGFKKWAKVVASIAVTVYSGGSASGAFGSFGLWGSSVTTLQAVGTIAVGGAVSGAISSGTAEGAFYGAFSALAFHRVGQELASAAWADGNFLNSGFSAPGLAAKTVGHGLIGGAVTHAQGGRFAHGFLSSGATAAASPYIAEGFNGNRFAQGGLAAIVGGSVSSLTGGKFANGATTAAMAFAFNQLSQEQIKKARAAAARERVSIRASVDDSTGEHTYRIRGEICSSSSHGCNAALADRIYNEYVNQNDVPFVNDDLGGGQKDLLPFGRGSIFHIEQPGVNTSINQTLETHLLHPGDVTHNVYFQNDVLYYEVIGTGYGAFPRANNVIGIGLFVPGVVEAVYRYGR